MKLKIFASTFFFFFLILEIINMWVHAYVGNFNLSQAGVEATRQFVITASCLGIPTLFFGLLMIFSVTIRR